MTEVSGLVRFLYARSPAAVRDWAISRFSAGRSRLKFGPAYHAALTDLARTQWYDTEQLMVLQDEKLRRMVHWAATHVPFWRERFADLGLRPDDIGTAADLARLPVLEKDEVQREHARLVAEPYRDSKEADRYHTSGTTGRPVELVIDHDCLQMEKAYTWLHRSWGGVSLGDATAAFVGFPVVPTGQRRPPFWVHDSVENRTIFSLQHLAAEHLPAYADALAALAPRMIYGYPTAISIVARHLRATGDTRVRPRAVFTASETLLPHHREAMEAAFGCRVFDWYGASEMIANIVQCEEGSYHVKAEYGVVEVLRPDGTPCGPGEEGALVGTGLNNLAMPLLRYRVGDAVVPRAGSCPCGRGGALMERITGRLEDVLVTPDGRWLTRLDFVFKGIEGVEEAQLYQEDPRRVTVRVVPRTGFDGTQRGRIEANLRDRVGKGMEIAIVEVESIPRTAGGKFRYVVSSVARDAVRP